MEPFKAQGSFGIPQGAQRQMEEARKRVAKKIDGEPEAPPAIPQQAQEIPPEGTQAKAPPTEKEVEEQAKKAQEKEFLKAKAALEEELEITITPDDIKDYIFKGRMTKKIHIVKGALEGTFQTLNPDEVQKIDELVADFRSSGKNTQEGYDNERAMVTLSYAWLAANDRPISAKNDPEIRKKYIKTMGAHIVDLAVTKHRDFNTLIRLALREQAFVKKS